MTTTSSVFLPARKAKPVVTTGVLHKLMARRDARLAAGVSVAIVLVAAVGPLFTQDPDLVDYTNQLAAPSLEHLLGTDGAGRDLLARSVYGARTSLGAAALVTMIISVVGLLVGVIAGCVGGIFDTIASRIIDILLGLPGLIVTLAIVGMLGPGFVNLILAMSATAWAVLARLARAVALSAMHHRRSRWSRCSESVRSSFRSQLSPSSAWALSLRLPNGERCSLLRVRLSPSPRGNSSVPLWASWPLFSARRSSVRRFVTSPTQEEHRDRSCT